MSRRTMQATGLGSSSHETGKGVTLSSRLQLDFECPEHARFSVTFDAEAALPLAWDCPVCWAPSVRSDGTVPEVEIRKPVRTHWDMLRERRSVAELEELLAERLTLLRRGTIGPGVPEPIARTKRTVA